MSTSTSSVFHFTPEFEYLLSILQEGFRPTYCLEKHKLDDFDLDVGVPMVSFCDIPLSQLSSQSSSYGHYGLGMSKAWASTQKINPVIYMDQNSFCSAAISEFINYAQINDEFNDLRNRYVLDRADETKVQIIDTFKGERKVRIDAMNALLSYIKNSNGDLYRNCELHTANYDFYAEREWRFVPPEELLNNVQMQYHQLLMEDEFLEWRTDHHTKAFIEGISLGFNHKDIDYIIVSEDFEILPLIDHLRGMSHLFGSTHEMEILFTKVITMTKIISDL